MGPRNRANQGYALFAVPEGLLLASTLLPDDAAGARMGAALYLASAPLAIAGLVMLALSFPSRPRPEEGRFLGLALGAGVALAVPWLAWQWLWTGAAVAGGDYGNVPFAQVLAGQLVESLPASALFGLLILFALRAADPSRRRPLAVLATALAIPLFFRLGQYAHPASAFPAWDVPLRAGFSGMAVLAYGAAWLFALRAPGTRWGLVALWAGPAAALAGIALPIGSMAAFLLGTSVATAAGALVLAVAILRGKLPGFDRRLRWTIRSSTLGAFFVAAFFVVSELAQHVLGERTGQVFAIIVTGALVFVLAPLQRIAERVANAAVPPPPAAGQREEDAYRTAVRLAMRDRELSRAEERELVVLAETLGLGAARAMDIRDEVARDVRREAPAGEPA